VKGEKRKLIEEIIGDREKARKVAEIIDETVESGLRAIEEKAEKQKVVLKAQIREELRKELASREDIAITRQEIESVRQELKQKIESVRQELKQEIELVRQEIEIVRQELKGDIMVLKVMIYALFVFVALLNRETIEFIFKVLGILK
jgi:vacuolar-type H+-ATPase subunit I/STV1